MTKWGAWFFGVLVGVLAMQVGHALYLRSGDYWFAAVVTALVGGFGVWVINEISEDW